MEYQEIFAKYNQSSFTESLDYTVYSSKNTLKRHKFMSCIKTLTKVSAVNFKRKIPLEGQTIKALKKNKPKNSFTVNFRYPKVINFLFSRPCDEIIKVNYL